jgi:hypothetical protein
LLKVFNFIFEFFNFHVVIVFEQLGASYQWQVSELFVKVVNVAMIATIKAESGHTWHLLHEGL